MATCVECGASVPDGNKFCNVCGRPMTAQQTAVPAPQMASAAPVYPQSPAQNHQPPQYQYPPNQNYHAPPVSQDYSNMPPPESSRYAVMSVGGFFWSTVIIGIPLVGWLVCLIWACGGTKYQNKRNFCRAIIIFFLIGIVISACVYFLLRWTVGAAIDAAAASPGGSGSGLVAAKELLEMLLGYVNGLIDAQGQ